MRGEKMMKTNPTTPFLLRTINQFSIVAAAVLFSAASLAQDTVEWTTLGGDFAHTRYSPASQIDASNFSDLEVAWEWDGASF
jgi:quinoprotein glucose dehydrogenase